MSQKRDTDLSLDAQIAAAIRRLRAKEAVKDHPEVEDLVAYQESRLSEAAAEEIRHHLARCSECAEQVLQLDTFDEAPAPDLGPTNLETAADWRSFETRSRILPGAEDRDSAGGELGTGWKAAALAACVLVLVGALAVWWGSMGSVGSGPPDAELRESGEPPMRPFLFDLRPEGSTSLRSVDAVQQIEVPANLDSLLAQLLLGDQTLFERYRVTVFRLAGKASERRTMGGELVFQWEDLPRQPRGTFLIALPPKVFGPGRYRLELVGLDADEVYPLATYIFELVDAAEDC